MPNDLRPDAQSEEDADVGGDLESVAEVGAVASAVIPAFTRWSVENFLDRQAGLAFSSIYSRLSANQTRVPILTIVRGRDTLRPMSRRLVMTKIYAMNAIRVVPALRARQKWRAQ